MCIYVHMYVHVTCLESSNGSVSVKGTEVEEHLTTLKWKQKGAARREGGRERERKRRGRGKEKERERVGEGEGKREKGEEKRERVRGSQSL